MITRISRRIAGLVLLVFAGVASANTITYTGTLDSGDPTFDHTVGTATDLTLYDQFDFTVDADGTYSFLSVYAGDTANNQQLDGLLILYPVFDPLAPANYMNESDDYFSGDIGALAAFDSACVGQNCSGFDMALTVGSYTLVQTAFQEAPSSFGQPTGAYEITITGPGNIGPVPLAEPGILLLMGSGLLLMSALRRFL